MRARSGSTLAVIAGLATSCSSGTEPEARRGSSGVFVAPLTSSAPAGLVTPAAVATQVAAAVPLEVQALREQLEESRRARARVERDFRLTESRLESRVAQLGARIQDLTRGRTKAYDEVALPDVRVLEVLDGQVALDAGTRDGLRRGTRFQLYDQPRGRTRLKAVAEVREVGLDRARALVLDRVECVDPETGDRLTLPRPDVPVAVGDLARNPFFQRGATKEFVILGTELEGATPLSELVQRLTASGSSVQASVGPSTDFVVVLADAQASARDQLEFAMRMGPVFMTEGELLFHLGLGPQPER